MVATSSYSFLRPVLPNTMTDPMSLSEIRKVHRVLGLSELAQDASNISVWLKEVVALASSLEKPQLLIRAFNVSTEEAPLNEAMENFVAAEVERLLRERRGLIKIEGTDSEDADVRDQALREYETTLASMRTLTMSEVIEENELGASSGLRCFLDPTSDRPESSAVSAARSVLWASISNSLKHHSVTLNSVEHLNVYAIIQAVKGLSGQTSQQDAVKLIADLSGLVKDCSWVDFRSRVFQLEEASVRLRRADADANMPERFLVVCVLNAMAHDKRWAVQLALIAKTHDKSSLFDLMAAFATVAATVEAADPSRAVPKALVANPQADHDLNPPPRRNQRAPPPNPGKPECFQWLREGACAKPRCPFSHDAKTKSKGLTCPLCKDRGHVTKKCPLLKEFQASQAAALSAAARVPKPVAAPPVAPAATPAAAAAAVSVAHGHVAARAEDLVDDVHAPAGAWASAGTLRELMGAWSAADNSPASGPASE